MPDMIFLQNCVDLRLHFVLISPLPLCCRAALVLSFLLRRYCLVVLWVCFAWVPSYTTAWLQESAVEVAVELM